MYTAVMDTNKNTGRNDDRNYLSIEKILNEYDKQNLSVHTV